MDKNEISNRDFNPLSFKLEEIIELKEHLKANVKGQDIAIDKIIKGLLNNVIRTTDNPIHFLLSGPSGVGKNLIVKEISKFLGNKYWDSYEVVTIDCSKYYIYEFATIFGASTGFSNSNDAPIFEKVADKLYDTSNECGGLIVNFTEVDKIKISHTDNKNKINEFFKSIMQLLEERLHTFKGGNLSNIEVDTVNIIYFFDGNFLSDNKIKEFKRKTGFVTDEEDLKTQEKKYYDSQSITQEKLVEYFKENLNISVFNRLNSTYNSIIQFNNISDDVKFDIFKLEYQQMLLGFRSNKYGTLKGSVYEKPSKSLYNKMIKELNIDSGARGIRNYVNSALKSEIINFLISNNNPKEFEKLMY